MDPLSTAIGILGAVTQVIDTTAKLSRYLCDVQAAPREKFQLEQELFLLSQVLQNLRTRIERGHELHPDSWLENVKILMKPSGVVEQLSEMIERIEKKTKKSSRLAASI